MQFFTLSSVAVLLLASLSEARYGYTTSTPVVYSTTPVHTPHYTTKTVTKRHYYHAASSPVSTPVYSTPVSSPTPKANKYHKAANKRHYNPYSTTPVSTPTPSATPYYTTKTKTVVRKAVRTYPGASTPTPTPTSYGYPTPTPGRRMRKKVGKAAN